MNMRWAGIILVIIVAYYIGEVRGAVKIIRAYPDRFPEASQ